MKIIRYQKKAFLIIIFLFMINISININLFHKSYAKTTVSSKKNIKKIKKSSPLPDKDANLPDSSKKTKNKIFFYLTIFIFTLSSLILGILAEKMLISKINKIMEKTKWEGYKIFTSSLENVAAIIFFIAGIYVVILYIPMEPNEYSIAQKIILICTIISITILISRISAGFVNQYVKSISKTLPATSFLGNIIKLSIFALGILVLLNTLGISISPILTALGVGGLAVALALQDTLSNLFSGLYIIATKEVEPGHYIKLSSGEEGYVTDITWRHTTIESMQGNVIVIPNSKFASSILTNYNRPQKEMSIKIQVGVSYESNLSLVEKITKEVGMEILQEIEGGVSEFQPLLFYHTFSDSSINFSVILRTTEFINQFKITHEFIKRLHERYKKEKINIPFPIRTLYMKNLN